MLRLFHNSRWLQAAVRSQLVGRHCIRLLAPILRVCLCRQIIQLIMSKQGRMRKHARQCERQEIGKGCLEVNIQCMQTHTTPHSVMCAYVPTFRVHMSCMQIYSVVLGLHYPFLKP